MAGKQAKLHMYLQRLSRAPSAARAPPAVRSEAAFGSQRSANLTVNLGCALLMRI